jgi:hypothetical protein
MWETYFIALQHRGRKIPPEIWSLPVFARVALVVLTSSIAAPALAQTGSVSIPEPGDAALFVIAVIGLVVGRQASRRAPRQDDDTQV